MNKIIVAVAMTLVAVATSVPVQAIAGGGLFQKPVSYEADYIKKEACAFTAKNYREHVWGRETLKDEARDIEVTRRGYEKRFGRPWTKAEELFETTISHCAFSKDCSFHIAQARCMDEVPGYIHEDFRKKIWGARNATTKRLSAR